MTLSKGHSLEFAAPHLTNAFECSACGRHPTFDISADEQGDFQLGLGLCECPVLG